MEPISIKEKKFYAVVLDMLLLNPKYREHRRKKKAYNARQKWFVLLLDLIVLAELAGSMFWAQKFGDAMPGVFIKMYLPMVVVTLILGKFAIKRLDTPEPVSEPTSEGTI